jgi:hypothetical protein
MSQLSIYTNSMAVSRLETTTGLVSVVYPDSVGSLDPDSQSGSGFKRAKWPKKIENK